MTAVRSPFDFALGFNNSNVRTEGKSKSLRIIEEINQNKIGARTGKTRIFKAVVGDFKVKASPTQLFLDTSLVIPNVELVNVHPLIKRLFSNEMLTKAVDIPLAGRINHFLVNWQKLTLN